VRAPMMFNLGGQYFLLNLYFSVPVLELQKKPTKTLRASSADDDKAKLKVSFFYKKNNQMYYLFLLLLSSSS
jgi:hypothetical protein